MRGVLCLLVIVFSVFSTVVYGQGSLIFVSRTGTLNSRVFCREVLQCVGTGTDVFWTFFGLGSNRVPNSETRFTNTSQEVINGSTVITANLTFAPVSPEHSTLYVCQVDGPNPASSNIRLSVETAPVILLSDIQDIDLSQHTIGEPITVSCQVETCLSDVTATFYKGTQVLQTTTVTNNMLNRLTFAYTITVAEDSAGEYACRAVTSQGGTPNDIFTLSGTPRAVSTSTTVSTTTSTSTSSIISPTVTTSSTFAVGNSVSISSTTVVSSPSMTPTGGCGHTVIQWSLISAMIVITLWSIY